MLENQSDSEASLLFLQLPEGLTVQEVTAAFEEAEAAPTFIGETSGAVLDLTAGEWGVQLSVVDPETGEPTDMPVTVTGEMPEVDQPQGQEISMFDMDFVVPDSLGSGPQLWYVVNNGLQVHHLAALRGDGR